MKASLETPDQTLDLAMLQTLHRAKPTNLNNLEFTAYLESFRSPATRQPSWIHRLNTRNLSFLTLTAFFSALIVLGIAFPVKSEIGEQEAMFTQVTYSARIHAETMDTWAFTVYNVNCSENDQDAARFFLRFYADNELWLDEYNSTQYRTWNCSKGSAVSHSYNIRGWNTIQPVTHDLRIELYWYRNSTAVLEDTTSFTIAVIIHVPLQNIFATGYLAAYLIACFLLFSYDYVQGLEE